LPLGGGRGLSVLLVLGVLLGVVVVPVVPEPVAGSVFEPLRVLVLLPVVVPVIELSLPLVPVPPVPVPYVLVLPVEPVELEPVP
jgi:hypothetical protein